MAVWLMMIYRVPRKPSACRTYVWRKLKKLGAVAVQDAAWVLPLNDQTCEHFEWLQVEIFEMGGEALVWRAMSLADGQDQALIRQFEAVVETGYRPILTKLRKRKHPDLKALSRQYQLVHTQDYFGSRLGREVREALLRAQGDQSS